MSLTVLITRPNFDPVTSYFHYWGKLIIDAAREYNCKIIDLEGEKAILPVFTGHIQKTNPKLVLLHGHGSPNEVCGHKNQVLVDSHSADLLSGKIVYAVSCRAARELGPASVRKGALAFIGYEEDFGFVTTLNREGNPAKDRMVQPFMRASNEVSESLLKSKTVEKSYQNSQEVFKEEIRNHSISDARPENKEIRFWLFWDMVYQKYHGSPDAQIDPLPFLLLNVFVSLMATKSKFKGKEMDVRNPQN